MTEPAVLDVPRLRLAVERRFRVYDVQADEHVVAFYINIDKDTLEGSFDELKKELKSDRLVPLLKYQGGEHAIYVLRTPHRTYRSVRLNYLLFALTVLTTTLAGAFTSFTYYNVGFDTSQITEAQFYLRLLAPSSLLAGFLSFALPLMLILTVHEFGHYILARRHGMEASLPFFIPVPPGIGLNIGTFGAFIAMREPMPNRKALFDVGAAGPIAGFFVAVPVLLIGFTLMALNPVIAPPVDEGTLYIGTPLLYNLLSAPFGLSENLLTHPTAFAGWVGLFVTAINLLPAGQLDGGHIASAMFGERARYASYGAVFALLALDLAPLLGFPGYQGWLFFALLIGLLGVRHPPTLDGVSELDSKRRLIGWLTFGMGALCFTLVPIIG